MTTAPALPCQCPQCGSDNLVVTDGTGPHLAALRCGDCDRWLKWLSKAELEAIQLKGVGT